MNQSNYIYLHGFSSSPGSTKAVFFRDGFERLKKSLEIPDLNGDNFFTLTLSRQITQVALGFPVNAPIVLIGSSLGALTAAWLGERFSQIQSIVLLAPAFGFVSFWLERLGARTIQEWQTSGSLPVYHYGQQRSLPIHYQFVRDLQSYRERDLQRAIPTLILHGRADEVIPIEHSREYAQTRSWVKLIELDSDHALTDVMPRLWQETQQFLGLPN